MSNLHQKRASKKNTESEDSSIKSVPAKEDSQKSDAEGEPKELNRQGSMPWIFRIINYWIKLAKLFSAVRKLLAKVNLSDCFKTPKDFAYSWYVEYPAFEHISGSVPKM